MMMILDDRWLINSSLILLVTDKRLLFEVEGAIDRAVIPGVAILH